MRSQWYWYGLVAGLACLLGTFIVRPSIGEDTRPLDAPSPGPISTENFKDQLKPIPCPTPEEAINALHLRPGFEVQLVAAEPHVQDPVALEIDEDGRMYVVEYCEYNQYANPNFKGPYNRVKLLVDRDGDGQFDTSTIFAEIPNCTAVGCYDGGVFVGAAPDIFYCKDTDGDGKADVQRKVYSGFGKDHAGEGMINCFRWGPDNQFYVSAGTDGGQVSRIGDKTKPPLSMRRRTFVFDPRTLHYDYTSGGGQHGMCLDDWGRIFASSNSEPSFLALYDERYLARNPYVSAPPAMETISTIPEDRKLYRMSPVENWRILRTQLRVAGRARGPVEGNGTASGYFTAGTGVTIYRGNAWPQEFRGNLLASDVANNVVYRARIFPRGIGLIARRAERNVEFVASSDIWFRPVQLANVPDGTLYLIDMARELIEGAAFLPEDILKHIDVASGMDKGRIYRLAPKGFKPPRPPQLSKATTRELVNLLESRNGWHRDTAARLLFERRDRAAIDPLRYLMKHSEAAVSRMHALYTLASLGVLRRDDLLTALRDDDPRVRIHAARLSEAVPDDPTIRRALVTLSGDSDRDVRYQVAFSLGAIPVAERIPALRMILDRDGSDRWFQIAIQSSLRESAAATELLSQITYIPGTGLVRPELYEQQKPFAVALAAQLGASGTAADLERVTDRIESLDSAHAPFARELVLTLLSQRQKGKEPPLKFAPDSKLLTIRKELLESALLTAAASDRKPTDRAVAIRQLTLAEYGFAAELLSEFLSAQQPQEVQSASLDALASYDRPEVSTTILDKWGGLSPQVRAHAIEILFSRKPWTKALLAAIERGDVPAAEVDPVRAQYLQNHADAEIKELAKKVLAKSQNAARADVVAKYQKALELKGDVVRGKAAFQKTCSTCHRLENVGTSIGADLTSIRTRGDAAILLNILDPNREVKPQFMTYVAVTKDGRSQTGLISAETANSLNIRRNDGSEVKLLRIDIEELNSTGLSFMPEGLEKLVDPQTMADLLAYFHTVK